MRQHLAGEFAAHRDMLAALGQDFRQIDGALRQREAGGIRPRRGGLRAKPDAGDRKLDPFQQADEPVQRLAAVDPVRRGHDDMIVFRVDLVGVEIETDPGDVPGDIAVGRLGEHVISGIGPDRRAGHRLSPNGDRSNFHGSVPVAHSFTEPTCKTRQRPTQAPIAFRAICRQCTRHLSMTRPVPSRKAAIGFGGACHGPTSSVSVVTTPSPRVLSTKFLTARQEANRLFGIRSGSKVSAEARFQRSSQACRSGWVEPVSKKPSGRSSKTSLPS